MPRRARIHFVSLRSSLVNLPISIYGPLLERNIRPQNLAVHLTLVAASKNDSNAKTEAYVGWTGMASASSLAHFNSSDSGERGLETIEIDPQYAQGLGLALGDVVEIGLLHDLPSAQSVATEPLSSDDWEIIEIHASHVESTLLSQVRVAKIGQEIDVWVLGRTRVRLRVVNLGSQSKNNVLLLTTNTEVSIAPKPHRSQGPTSSSMSSKTGFTTAQTTDTPSPKEVNITENAVRRNAQILRVLPKRIIRPPCSEYTGSELIAYVSPSAFLQLKPFDKSIKDTTTISCFQTAFKRLPPPIDPSSPASPTSPTPIARIMKPEAADKVNHLNSQQDSAPGRLYVGCTEGIPENHMVFPALPDTIQEWDLVQLSPLSDDSEIKVKISIHNSSVDIAPSTTQTSMPLAGVDDILKRCTDFCLRKFIEHSSVNVVHGVSALLLTGRPGAGKTSIVRAIAESIQEDVRTLAYTHYIDVSRFSDRPISAVKSLFRHWFDKAAWHRPTILVLDNLDKLLGAEVEHADSFRTRHITEVFVSMYSYSARTTTRNTRGIILLATATSTTALHHLISAAHIFQDVVNLKPPDKIARRDIIASIVKDRLSATQDIDQALPLNYTFLATQTEGYSPTDLQDLVSRALHQLTMRASNDMDQDVLTSADFAAAQVDFIPLSLRDVNLQKSDVAWSDIGGLHETRKVLRETLEWPSKYGPIFAQSPLRLRSGLLLYGFPGCGKTLLASAVAKECGLNFISVKGPEILNKYIGASEKSVRDLFERASAAKPCILFFDEFDSIAPKRGHDSTGVTDRVVNQMLTQMDGAEGLEGVYVLAATSRPDLIDSALLRPGRLDKSLFCGMPDLEERKDILRAVGQKVMISPSVDLDELAVATDGYSGADLQALVYNAHLEVIHASLASALDNQMMPREDENPIEFTTFGGPKTTSVASKAEKMALQRRLWQITSISHTKDVVKPRSTAPKEQKITNEHIRRVLKSMRPSVSPDERARLNQIYRRFISDRSGELPLPSEQNAVGSRVSLM